MGITRIRLQRFGRRNAPFYRVVVADSKAPRDGKFIEIVGTYNPMANKAGIKEVTFKVDRVRYWIGVGAKPSDRVAWLLGQFGILPPPVVPVSLTKRHLKKNPEKKTKRELREMKGGSFHTSAFSAAPTGVASTASAVSDGITPDAVRFELATGEPLDFPVEWGTASVSRAQELWRHEDTAFNLGCGSRMKDDAAGCRGSDATRMENASGAAAAALVQEAFEVSRGPFLRPFDMDDPAVSSLDQKLSAANLSNKAIGVTAAVGRRWERTGDEGSIGLLDVMDAAHDLDAVVPGEGRAPPTPVWLWPGFDEYVSGSRCGGAVL